MRLGGDGDRRTGGRRPRKRPPVRFPQECGTLRRAAFLHFATGSPETGGDHDDACLSLVARPRSSRGSVGLLRLRHGGTGFRVDGARGADRDRDLSRRRRQAPRLRREHRPGLLRQRAVLRSAGVVGAATRGDFARGDRPRVQEGSDVADDLVRLREGSVRALTPAGRAVTTGTTRAQRPGSEKFNRTVDISGNRAYSQPHG